MNLLQMKIIKKGIPKAKRVWTGTCNSCDSHIEALESELEPQHDQRDGPWAIAICPVCSNVFTLHPTEERREQL